MGKNVLFALSGTFFRQTHARLHVLRGAVHVCSKHDGFIKNVSAETQKSVLLYVLDMQHGRHLLACTGVTRGTMKGEVATLLSQTLTDAHIPDPDPSNC